MSFLSLFKERIRQFEGFPTPPASEVVEPLFDVHRKSLPYGLNQPVAWGLTKEQAASLIEVKLRAQVKQGVVIYYDSVRSF